MGTMNSPDGYPTLGQTAPLGAHPVGAPGLWHADPAHSVVSIVQLRQSDHGCEFALRTDTVDLDTRGTHTSLELRVNREPVVCAR